MNTPSQTARWTSDAAVWGAVQAAVAAGPSGSPAGLAVGMSEDASADAAALAAAWPVVAGLSPVQALEAVAVLRASLAAGPVLDEAAARLRVALDAPAAGVPGGVAGGIDLAPFQALLDEFRAAEQAPGGLLRLPELPGALPAVAPVAVASATLPATPGFVARDGAPGFVVRDGAPGFVVQDGAGGSRLEAGAATDGAVDYLRAQYIHVGAEGVSIGAAVSDVFIKGDQGDDALAALSGRNVLDGGRGSNFLVGGSGVDTYFIDGRGGQVTWGTVVGFEAGEIITLWGFDPAVSRLSWVESQGAAGYQGRTLHADLDGDGAASALVTVAGADAQAASRWALTTGSDGTNPYLAIINLG